MGNRIRVQEGEKPLRLADILRRRDIWKFILIRDQKIKESKFNKKYASNDYFSVSGDSPHPPSDYSLIDKYYDAKKGRINYKELIRYFPNTIKSKRSTKNNKGIFIQTAIKLREEFEKKLIFAIEMGFIDSYEKLRETISKARF